MWVRAFEIWLANRLLASPAFHRLVRKAHKKAHEIRHGPSVEEMGGVKIDKTGSDTKKFFEYFMEELKDQFRGGSRSKH